MTDNKLTDKQRLFIKEYLVDRNATQAAIRAGYSEATATAIGCENLSKPYIRAEVDKQIELQEKRVLIKADDILIELKKVAFADIKKMFDSNGNLLPISEIPDETIRAISSVESDELFEGHGKDRERTGDTKKIKLWDKLKALELLGKHLKMFTDKHEITGANGEPLPLIVSIKDITNGD